MSGATRARRSSARSRLAPLGYTAVEVMLSIAILGIGAAGVMGMQKSAIQGNQDARKLDLANALARTWIERLRRDAAAWTLPSEANPNAAANWSSTVFLPGLVTRAGTFTFPAANANGTWVGYSPAFDLFGRDVAPSGSGATYPGAIFCTQAKVDWLKTNELMRVTVRVFWPAQLVTAPSGDFCNADGTTAGLPSASDALSTYHFVYATTAIRKNPAK